MKAKSLAHWTDLFKVADSPWLRSDWDAVLNIVCKLLSMTNAIHDVKNQSLIDGTANFNELFAFAQLYFGVPRLNVVCDTKQTIGENQLSIITILHALKYSTPIIDSRRIRGLFAAQTVIEYPIFDLEVDGSSRYCARCGSLVALVERCFVEGVVWHRACLRCCVCKRQVSPGAFTFLKDGKHLECVEHFANRVLFGDAMHCIEQKKPTVPATASPKTSQLTKIISPPPRPPPPKKSTTPQSRDSTAESRSKSCRDETEKKNKPLSIEEISPKSSPHSSEKNWEVVYPTELNPFGSEDEDDESHQFDLDFDESGKTSSSNNPFSDDSDDDDKATSDLEEVENPSDRVVSSNDNFSPSKYDRTERSSCVYEDARSCQSINTPPSSVASPIPKLRSIPNKKLSETVDYEESDDDNNPFTRSDATTRANDKEQTETNQSTPAKPPRLAESIAEVTSDAGFERRYLPPDLIFRGKKTKLICGTTFYELSIQLRKLNCQISQLETTGKRLETQILRNVSSGKFEWKKCKTVEEYLTIIEKKCDAFRIENTLVHEYMNAFVDDTHAEVEKQLKELDVSNTTRRGELEKLLATLLDIKNTLMLHTQQMAPITALHNHPMLKTPSPADACRSLKKFSSPSVLKKSVKQTMKSLKKKL